VRFYRVATFLRFYFVIMTHDQCRAPSDDGRYRRKHVKVLFILKFVALDGAYSLVISDETFYSCSHPHCDDPSGGSG
jgi:hypothetical protein